MVHRLFLVTMLEFAIGFATLLLSSIVWWIILLLKVCCRCALAALLSSMQSRSCQQCLWVGLKFDDIQYQKSCFWRHCRAERLCQILFHHTIIAPIIYVQEQLIFSCTSSPWPWYPVATADPSFSLALLHIRVCSTLFLSWLQIIACFSCVLSFCAGLFFPSVLFFTILLPCSTLVSAFLCSPA